MADSTYEREALEVEMDAVVVKKLTGHTSQHTIVCILTRKLLWRFI